MWSLLVMLRHRYYTNDMVHAQHHCKKWKKRRKKKTEDFNCSNWSKSWKSILFTTNKWKYCNKMYKQAQRKWVQRIWMSERRKCAWKSEQISCQETTSVSLLYDTKMNKNENLNRKEVRERERKSDRTTTTREKREEKFVKYWLHNNSKGIIP